MKKKLSLITIVGICCSVLLGGCGKKMTLEDVPVYTQAVIDARYKADYSGYMEYKKCEEYEASQIHENGLNAVLNTTKVGGASISTELRDKYRQLFTDLNALCKITVGEAKEDGNGFSVEVTAEPFAMFDGIDQSLIDALAEADSKTLTNDEEIHQFLYEKMYQLITPRLSSPKYGTPETITLHIQPNADKVQTISEEDLNALDAMIYGALL